MHRGRNGSLRIQIKLNVFMNFAKEMYDNLTGVFYENNNLYNTTVSNP